MNVETEGIVLKQTPYREKDAMVSIITKDGIVNFLARGIKSPTSKNASSCLLFAHSVFSLNAKGNNKSLSQGKLINAHMSIYQSLEKMSAIQLISEALSRFISDEENSLFDYFCSFIDQIEKGFDSKTLVAIMLAKIIMETGYDLEFNNCVCCGSTKNIVNISYKLGGFICSECANKNKLGTRETNYLNSYRYCFMIGYDNLDHYVLDSYISGKLINEFITYLCDQFGVKELKSYEIYQKSISL